MEKVNYQEGTSDVNLESTEENITKTFNCETCNKSYKRKYNLNRHVQVKHKINEVIKLKLHNENLRFQIKIYCDQIKFIKRLILIQDLTLRNYRVKDIKPNEKNEQMISRSSFSTIQSNVKPVIPD